MAGSKQADALAMHRQRLQDDMAHELLWACIL